MVDRVPEAKFGGNASAKVMKNIYAVSTLGRCGKSNEFDRCYSIKKPGVGRCSGVVEFINDYDVEVFRIDAIYTA